MLQWEKTSKQKTNGSSNYSYHLFIHNMKETFFFFFYLIEVDTSIKKAGCGLYQYAFTSKWTGPKRQASAHKELLLELLTLLTVESSKNIFSKPADYNLLLSNQDYQKTKIHIFV